MAYSTNTDVKKRLKGTFDANDDADMDHFIEQGDAYIDNMLKTRGISVPLSPVPVTVKHASADLAAALFHSREQPPDEKRIYFEQADLQVEKYVSSLGSQGTIKFSEPSEDRPM